MTDPLLRKSNLGREHHTKILIRLCNAIAQSDQNHCMVTVSSIDIEDDVDWQWKLTGQIR